MQAEIPPTLKRNTSNEQAAPAVTCPLCYTPLHRGTPSTAQQTIVMCPKCGYSAPYVQRQPRISEASPVQRQPAGSSVWIDPAVSAYLAGALGSDARAEQSPGLPPQSRHVRQNHSVSPVVPTRATQKRETGPHATPIPHRASASQPNAVKVRPKYSRAYTRPLQLDSDVSRIPTLPRPTMWQYETPSYDAESSLSSLSLVEEAPTHPQTMAAQDVLERPLHIDAHDTQAPKPQKQNTHVAEIATRPRGRRLSQHSSPPQHITDIDKLQTLPQRLLQPAAQTATATHASSDIDKMNTLPPRVVPSEPPQRNTSLVPTRAVLPPAPIPSHGSPLHTINLQAAAAPTEQIAIIGDPSSWTAGGERESAYARRIADRSSGRKQHHGTNPFDHLRWWLLHPGRLEGILWLAGTLLLISVTFALLIVSALSLSWLTSGSQNGNASPFTTTDTASTVVPTVVTSHGLTLILENTGLIVPGQAIQLHGQGFSPRGQITFTDEHQHALLVQGSQTNAVQADDHGTFAISLITSSWTVGLHQLEVLDVASGRTANLSIILNSGPFGKNATPTTPAGVTATPNPNNSGNFPTPVNATPAPITTPTLPPATPTPAPTRVTPTPTATVGITPTATPGITPTVGTTPSPGTTPTPASQDTTPTPSAQSNHPLATAGTAGESAVASPWLWLVFAGYTLAMLILGIAGLFLKRRNHPITH